MIGHKYNIFGPISLWADPWSLVERTATFLLLNETMYHDICSEIDRFPYHWPFSVTYQGVIPHQGSWPNPYIITALICITQLYKPWCCIWFFLSHQGQSHHICGLGKFHMITCRSLCTCQVSTLRSILGLSPIWMGQRWICQLEGACAGWARYQITWSN